MHHRTMRSINYSMFVRLKGQSPWKETNKNIFTPWRRIHFWSEPLKERLTPQVKDRAASQFFAKPPGAAVCLDISFSKCSFFYFVYSRQKKTNPPPRIIPSCPRSTRCQWTPLYSNTKPFTQQGYSLALPVYRVSLQPDASWQEVLLSIPAQRARCLGFFVPAEGPALGVCG